MEEELNLSTGGYFKADDKGNYIDIIIWLMRIRADIRNGHPYRPMPKPAYSSDIRHHDISRIEKVDIGIRRRYSPKIVLAIYQLHRAGHNESRIACETGIPITTIRKLIEHKTANQRKVWMLAHQLRIPSRQNIFQRLHREI